LDVGIPTSQQEITSHHQMPNPTAQNNTPKDLAAAIAPIARSIVERSLNGYLDYPAVHAQINSLASGFPANHRVTTVVGALMSAIIELDRQVTLGKFPPGASIDQLAIELIRLAYNRWQRERRAASRLQSQTAIGESRNQHAGIDLGRRLLDQIPSTANSPENHAHFRQVVDQVVERLSPLDVQILILFADGHSTVEIANRIGCHRTSISRKIDRFADLVRAIISNDD
jgi:RNA polymerase sigma factor (sigma-70 family)